MHRALLSLLVFLAIGCGQTLPAPDHELPLWVRHTPRIPGVLRGVACGPDRAAAVAAARAEVLAQLRVSIDADREERLRISETRTIDSEQAELRRSLTEVVQQRVQFDDVPGLTPIREHRDADGETWVMVELDLQAWGDDLRQRLQDCDQRLAALMRAWPTQADPVDALLHARSLVPLLIQRQQLVDLLRVVQADDAAAPVSALAVEAMQQRLSEAARAAPVAILVEGVELRQLPDVVSMLSSRGLVIVPDPAEAVLHLALRLEQLQRQYGRQWRVDGTISGELVRSDTKQRIDSFRVSGRSSGTDAAVAGERLLEKLAPAVAEAAANCLFGLSSDMR